MTEEHIASLIRMMLFVALEVSAPILALMLIIGLGVSIFQSVTQITETTLIFIPKLAVFALSFALLFPWVMKILVDYTQEILIVEWGKVIQTAQMLTLANG